MKCPRAMSEACSGECLPELECQTGCKCQARARQTCPRRRSSPSSLMHPLSDCFGVVMFASGFEVSEHGSRIGGTCLRDSI